MALCSASDFSRAQSEHRYVDEVSQHTMGSNYHSGNFILEIVITPSWLKS